MCRTEKKLGKQTVIIKERKEEEKRGLKEERLMSLLECKFPECRLVYCFIPSV